MNSFKTLQLLCLLSLTRGGEFISFLVIVFCSYMHYSKVQDILLVWCNCEGLLKQSCSILVQLLVHFSSQPTRVVCEKAKSLKRMKPLSLYVCELELFLLHSTWISFLYWRQTLKIEGLFGVQVLVMLIHRCLSLHHFKLRK